MKIRKRECSLNYAPLTDDDIKNLQLRQGLITNAQSEIMKWQSIRAMLIDASNYYKQELLTTKKLRKGKKYVFDYEHKYIHRPNMKPWENGQPAPSCKPCNNDEVTIPSEKSELAEAPRE